VNNEGWAAGTRNGWLLTIFFFLDAYLLGEWLAPTLLLSACLWGLPTSEVPGA
jgi:hypothetical protein